jgi:hypothetical protein
VDEMLTAWKRFLNRLALSRGGQIAFTLVTLAGFGVALADDVMTGSGAEADSGPNAATIVGSFTVAVLVLVVVLDRAIAQARSSARNQRY